MYNIIIIIILIIIHVYIQVKTYMNSLKIIMLCFVMCMYEYYNLFSFLREPLFIGLVLGMWFVSTRNV